MRIALVNSNRKMSFYPIALLKIGAWLKSEGVECEIFDNKLPSKNSFDEIWITTVFTFDVYYVASMIKKAKTLCEKIKVGGISATLLPDFFEKLNIDVHQGLHPQAEKFSPDYTLIEKPEYSITHTSRGCVRKCDFCMVKKLEPVFKKRDWIKDINPSVKKILFYDNNWLAKKKSDLFNDIDLIHGLIDSGKITKIDFNQGLDARLLTEEIAERLQGIPFEYVRFAFDGMHENGYYQKAVELMVKYGFRDFMTYVLYNFEDTPQGFYFRLKESVFLTEKFKIGCDSFPMRFQPILDIDKSREYIGQHWKSKYLKAFMSILGKSSISGQVSSRSIKEFEYWFGKDENEFMRLLAYPKIHLYMKRKKAFIRFNPEIRELHGQSNNKAK